MSKKKIRIGLEDSDGAKYDIKLEGNVTKEKVLKIFEMMDLMNIEEQDSTLHQRLDSVGGKIWNIVDKYYLMGKFTSNDLLEKYEDEYNEPIKLSMISTYLARFTEKGRVNRAKSGREWTYQMVKITPKQS